MPEQGFLRCMYTRVPCDFETAKSREESCWAGWSFIELPRYLALATATNAVLHLPWDQGGQ